MIRQSQRANVLVQMDAYRGPSTRIAEDGVMNPTDILKMVSLVQDRSPDGMGRSARDIWIDAERKLVEIKRISHVPQKQHFCFVPVFESPLESSHRFKK